MRQVDIVEGGLSIPMRRAPRSAGSMYLGLRVQLPEPVWNLFGGVLTERRFLLKSNPEDAENTDSMSGVAHD